jgi:hypothetical protein
MDAAIAHCTKGAGIWEWVSNEQGPEPDGYIFLRHGETIYGETGAYWGELVTLSARDAFAGDVERMRYRRVGGYRRTRRCRRSVPLCFFMRSMQSETLRLHRFNELDAGRRLGVRTAKLQALRRFKAVLIYANL